VKCRRFFSLQFALLGWPLNSRRAHRIQKEGLFRLDESAAGKENIPTAGKSRRPLYDIPYMFEAREFLRKKLIGKKITVSVDYVQLASEKFPEKTCCTVVIGGQ